MAHNMSDKPSSILSNSKKTVGEANIHYEIEVNGNLDWAHWTDGPFCPHCGEREAIRTIHGQTTRPGIYHCLTCRKRFAGTLDILFQNSTGAPPPEPPFMVVLRKIWNLQHQRGVRVLSYPVWYVGWYGGHILRQLIAGSDPTPPTKP
ncbi:MAG: transposase [Alphaproteobacteria bacterium]